MVKKKEKSEIIMEITRIRERIDTVNKTQHTNIKDQYQLSSEKIQEHIEEKMKYLKDYVNNLRKLATDDISIAFLDTIQDQISVIKSEYEECLEGVLAKVFKSVLHEIDDFLLSGELFLDFAKRLQKIEDILNTHIGAPKAEGS